MLSGRPLPHNVRWTTAARGLLFSATLTLAALYALAAPAQQLPPTPTPRSAATRARRFLSQRSTALATQLSAAQALARARQQHLALVQLQPQVAGLTAAWQPLGPATVTSATFGALSGRVTALALDPNDASGNTLYLGTTGGGVWKSTNAASSLALASFTPLTDTLPVFAAGGSAIASLAIGALAVQPAPSPIVLAGTGDPNDASDSYYGQGLLRSTDGGLTWSLIAGSHDGVNGNHSFIGLATAGLAFSTATPTLAVAAFSTSTEAANVAAINSASIAGLYYSTDAGVTWQMATLYDGATVVQQPQPLGTGQVGNAVTSVVWDALRGRFFAAVRSHGYYSSADGIAWTRLTAQPGVGLTTANCPVGLNGAGASTCPIFRGVLTAQPATGDLYALTVDANDGDQGLWQDLCNAGSNGCATAAPSFAARLDNGALENGTTSGSIAQGSYNLALAALPSANNGTLLFAGTIDLYRCVLAQGATACSFRDTTNALDGCNAPAKVAPAQHALAGVAQSGGAPMLFLGNDGGLWRSLDGVAETGSVCAANDSTHFDDLNPALGLGGSLAEITGFAQDPAASGTLLAGLGGDGSAGTTAALPVTAWPQLSAGEGGAPHIDPTTAGNWFLAIGTGINLAACTLGGSCTAASFAPPATVGEPQVSYDAALLDAPTLLDPTLPTDVLLGTCRVWRGPATSGAAWSTADALSPAFDGSTTPCTATSALVRSLAAGGPASSAASAPLAGASVLYAGLAGSGDGGGTLPGHLFVNPAAGSAAVLTTWSDAALNPVTNDTANNHQFNPFAFDLSSVAVDPHDPTGATVYATVMGFGAPHLYRSTDFGAHWLNLSANLPDAPANALAVDPNDANTVYIALDTGVYVTQAITTCSTANCWSVLGTALPNAPITALAAGANLPTGDGRLGLLRAASYGRGLWQLPLLTAAAPAQPALMLSASALTFAAQQVQTQSAAQTLTVTGSGNAAVTFSTLTIGGDFTETDTCSGQTLSVGTSCSVQVVFAPTATGARSGLLTLYANVAGGQATVALAGTGTAPAAIVFTPLTLSFAATLVNRSSTVQTLSLANTGGNAATLQAPLLLGADPGDFSIAANTCTSTLGPSTACALSIVFTPTSTGTRTATLSVTDSAGTQTATLTGVGESPATDTLSPAALTFATQTIGATSAAQLVTLTNAGDVPLTLIAAATNGTQFAVVNGCGNSLAAHATCAFSVTFIPAATGPQSATLTVSDQFRTQTVGLSGSGVAPAGVSLTPTTAAFNATGVGLLSPAQVVTLTNNGGLPLTIAGTALGPGFSLAANTCPGTLAAGAACALTVVFAPTAAGPATATLTLTDNAGGGAQSIALTGTGIDFTLAASGATSATLSGSTISNAAYPLLLSSLAGLSGNVALACTGAPANATCTVQPTVAGLGGSSVIMVTVHIGVSVVELRPPGFGNNTPFGEDPSLLALALPLSLTLRRRRGKIHVALLLALFAGCAALSFNGCGTGRIIPASTANVATAVTPPGAYNLTVSAAAAGLTRTVGLTLIVQ